MNKTTAAKIIELSINGIKPAVIAEKLGVSVNTVKSHIRRHAQTAGTPRCLFCGKPVAQTEGRKEKTYCSDKCRMNYWNRQYRGKEQCYGE